jgi:transposase
MSTLKTPNGRLREDGARAVLAARAEGKTYQAIAEQVGVSIGTVYNICKGRTWAWLSSVEAHP